MPLFPSSEWMADFCQRLEEHPEAPEVAPALDGIYRFVIEPAGPLVERHTYVIAITPVDDGAEVTLIDEGDDIEPRLSMSADYRRWQQLVRGELDIAMAVMLRRLRVSGDLTGLVGSVSSGRPLIESLHAVETTWLED